MSDIQALFQKDPLQLTKADLTEICTYYREKFQAFQLGDKTAGATKKMKSGEPSKKLSADELKDLLSNL
jgi:hypothetical protein